MGSGKCRYTVLAAALVAALLMPSEALCQGMSRREIAIPDVLGYKAVMCDFHMHTVFSDGRVWPDVRVGEAWRDGLHALAITDHVEYARHKDDIPKKLNRSHELAMGPARQAGLILVKGAEITRKMPPGHFNVIFTQDTDSLDTPEWRDAMAAAIRQGAFMFWNHPGRDEEVWKAEHTEIYEKGWLQGVEVVNGSRYYAHAHKWCLEKNLAMIGTSDVHGTIDMSYDRAAGEHRPVTIALAEDYTEEAVKDALVSRRTVIYWENELIGKPEHLRAIFDASSVEVLTEELALKPKGRAEMQVRNTSDVSYELELDGEADDIWARGKVTLPAHRTVRVRIGRRPDTAPGEKTIRLPYRVSNLKVAPEQGLQVELSIRVKLEES